MAPPTDVIPAEELLTSPLLLNLDYQDRTTQVLVVLGTFVLFLASFLLSLPLATVSASLRALKFKHRVFLALAVSRGIYGVFCTVFGGHALMVRSNLDRDVVHGTTASSALAMLVTIGFFIFEFSTVIGSDFYFGSSSKLLLFHHGLGLASYTLAVNNQAVFGFGVKAITLELSTPFSCACFVLLKMGMERSVLWKINQILLVHTFHIRSMIECYMWYETYQNWGHIWANMPMGNFVTLYLSLVSVTFMMTPYWGWKKTQQLFNPVDWNHQEAATEQTVTVQNGEVKKVI